MSARDFLIRGLLAGLIAAFAAFAVAYVVGEPSVRAAIALEDSAGGHSHGTETTDAAGRARRGGRSGAPVRSRCPARCSPPSGC